MILVDSSIWIAYLREGNAQLSLALGERSILGHPYVIGEVACGNLKDRGAFLQWMHELPPAPVAADTEVLRMIETRGLMGRGVGYLDVHLLASATLAGARLWTRDIRLTSVARDLGLDHEP